MDPRNDLKNVVAFILIGLLAYVAFSDVIAPKIMPRTQCPEGFINDPENDRLCIAKEPDQETFDVMKQGIALVLLFVSFFLVFGAPWERGKKNGK